MIEEEERERRKNERGRRMQNERGRSYPIVISKEIDEERQVGENGERNPIMHKRGLGPYMEELAAAAAAIPHYVV